MLNALSVALPIAVGLVAWSQPTTARFAPLLVAVGVAYFVVALSTSRDDAVYSERRA